MDRSSNIFWISFHRSDKIILIITYSRSERRSKKGNFSYIRAQIPKLNIILICVSQKLHLMELMRYNSIIMLVSAGLTYIRRRYYSFVSLTIHHRKLRWILTFLLASLYLYRAVGLSYDVITYLIGFYFLQLLVSYLTPKGLEEDQSYEQYDQMTDTMIIESVDTSMLADINSQFEFQKGNEGEKPLVSSLSEWQIWERISFAFFLGIICTMFKAIQIDVFWPLLMFYFVVLVSYTVHKIVRKMHRYKYTLSDFNKKPETF